MIGVGRVGLPFALHLLEHGMDVIGVDRDPTLREIVNEQRRMPFDEPGFEHVIAAGKLKIVATVDQAGDRNCYLLTLGTPVGSHLEADLDAMRSVFGVLGTVVKPGDLIVLRSTLAPGTSLYLSRLLERASGLTRGKDFGFSYCPERLAEGRAREELTTVPQIVGVEDEYSRAMVRDLFGPLPVEKLYTNIRTAELAKLYANVGRYVEFATANYLAMTAVHHDVEPFEVLSLVNHNYPRPVPGRPGLTAGTCLRKDFGLLSEGGMQDSFLLDAWRINETLPDFLVSRAAAALGELSTKRVGVLGLTFKANSDDLRDSLALKLVRLLARRAPAELRVYDPFVANVPELAGYPVEYARSAGELVRTCDVTFVATNHTSFVEESRALTGLLAEHGGFLVDPWNCLKTGRMFSRL